MVLELDEKEKEMLKRALEVFEDELRDEMLKTDKRQYRTLLHEEEDVLKGILRKVA